MAGSQHPLNLDSVGQAVSSLYLMAAAYVPSQADSMVITVIPTEAIMAALEAVFGEELGRDGLERHLNDHSAVGSVGLGLGDSILFTYTPTNDGVGEPPSWASGRIPPWFGAGTISGMLRDGKIPSGGTSDDPTASPLIGLISGFIGFGRTGLYSKGPDDDFQKSLDKWQKVIDEGAQKVLGKKNEDIDDHQRQLRDLMEAGMKKWEEYDASAPSWLYWEPKPDPPAKTIHVNYPADPWGDMPGTSGVGDPPPGFEKVFPLLDKTRIGNLDIDYPPGRRMGAPKVYDASGLILPPTADDGTDPRTGHHVLSKAERAQAEAVLTKYLPPPLDVDPAPSQLVVAAGVRALAYVMSGSNLMLNDSDIARIEGKVISI